MEVKTIKKLKWLNVALFALHIASAIFIFSRLGDISPRFTSMPVLAKTVVGEEKQLFVANLPVLICAFFLLTSMFHLFYAFSPSYARTLEKGSNPLRWVEYSITATLMVVILALSANLQTFTTLVALAAASFAVMLIGGVVEQLIAKPDGERLSLAKWLTFVAWALQLAIFFVVGFVFVNTIRDVNNKLLSEAATQTIPKWVYFILLSELCFFSLFGVVQLVQLRNVEKHGSVDFTRYEVGYHLLSLFAKLTLGWVFFAGTAFGSP
jgi:hypothetical protein